MTTFPLLLLLLAAAAPDPSKPVPIDRSFGFSEGDYPVEALRERAEGVVRFQLEVDDKGMPAHCSILVSSGHYRLDVRTCELLRLRARFTPAQGTDGKPVASLYSSTVSWRMPAMAGRELFRATTIKLPINPGLPDCEAEWFLLGNLPGQECESLIMQHAPLIRELTPRYSSLTFVVAMSETGQPPETYKPNWGARLSTVLIEQAFIGSWPQSCRTIRAEGRGAGSDGCAGFNRAKAEAGRAPDEGKPATTFVDSAIYGVSRR